MLSRKYAKLGLGLSVSCTERFGLSECALGRRGATWWERERERV